MAQPKNHNVIDVKWMANTEEVFLATLGSIGINNNKKWKYPMKSSSSVASYAGVFSVVTQRWRH